MHSSDQISIALELYGQLVPLDCELYLPREMGPSARLTNKFPNTWKRIVDPGFQRMG
jgi:hypothetical protein